MVPPKSHDQSRGEMCYACGEKAGSRKVLESLGILIRKWAQLIWSPDVMSYPCGICNTYRRLIYKCDSGVCTSSSGVIQGTDRWKTFKLEKINFLMVSGLQTVLAQSAQQGKVIMLEKRAMEEQNR